MAVFPFPRALLFLRTEYSSSLSSTPRFLRSRRWTLLIPPCVPAPRDTARHCATLFNTAQT